MASWSHDARRFLEAHRVGHLATAGADGAPHVIPVCERMALDDPAEHPVVRIDPVRVVHWSARAVPA